MAKRKRPLATIRQPALPDLATDKRKRRELPALDEGLLQRRFPIPEVEYRFATSIGREWRLDYAWPPYKVALEFEGGTWGKRVVDVEGTAHRVVKSRHTDPMGFAEDCRKYNTAAAAGWCVLKTNDQLIRDGSIFEQLEAALRNRGWTP